jgi:hypothetical protein
MLTALAYASVADTGAGVPGGAPLRLWIDHYGASVFRPVADYNEIVAKATEARSALRAPIVSAIERREFFKASDFVVWTVGQVAAAMYSDIATTRAELAELPPIFELIANLGPAMSDDGRIVGWKDNYPYPRAETPLWIIIALSAALKRQDALKEETRRQYLDYLDNALRIAEVYQPRDGGWNVVVQDKPEDQSIYSTALALHALLELRTAGLCWRGSCERREQLIRSTAEWLIAAFVAGDITGWRRGVNDDRGPDADLSLIVYGALAQAQVDAGVPLPMAVETAAVKTLADLVNRPYFPTEQEYTHSASFIGPDGGRQSSTVTTRMLWYPWGVKAVVQWRRYAQQKNLAPEIQRNLQRSLGYLILTLSKTMLADMLEERRLTFARAETWYGLDQVQ